MIRMFDTSGHSFPEGSPLAELWFGVHPKGRAVFLDETGAEVSLDKKLKEFSGRTDLTYLAKILSVAQILSLQLHPDSDTAKCLHAERPASYPDPSAKPEMAIALSEGSLLCGVRPLDEIRELLLGHPGFSELKLDSTLVQEEDIRVLVSSILKLSQAQVEKFYDTTMRNLSQKSPFRVYDEILRSSYQYLGSFDAGMPLLYLFSYVSLKKRDAVFIDAGVPHAYVSGDFFECMKCSDNVVRGGLTPKEIDKEMFTKLIRLEPYSPLLKPNYSTETCSHYEPEGCPFKVVHINSPDEFSYEIGTHYESSMLICVEGEGSLLSSGISQKITKGQAIFMFGKGSPCTIQGSGIEVFLIHEK